MLFVMWSPSAAGLPYIGEQRGIEVEAVLSRELVG